MINAPENHEKKKAILGAEVSSKNIPQTKNNGNEASAQRARLLASLRIGPINTLAARHLIDVLHPAARIQELREEGHNIATVWTQDVTPEGNHHRVAKYVLMSESSMSTIHSEICIGDKSKALLNPLGRAGNNDPQGSLDLGPPCSLSACGELENG